MTRETSKPAWYGPTVAALLLALVVLGAINLWRGFRPRGQADEAASAAVPVESPPPAPSRPPASPQGTAPAVEPGQRETAPAASDRAARPVPGPGDRAPAGQEREPPPMTPAATPEAAGPPDGAKVPMPGLPGQGPAQSGSVEKVAPRPAAPSAEKAAAPEAKHPPDEDAPAGADTSDRTPPALAQLRFEPGVVEGGSATTLTILATDDLSGVKSVRGEIQSPSGKASLPLFLQETRGGNSFTYVVSLPPAAEAGVWFVKWLHLTDMANNSALIQAASAAVAPPGGTFSVSFTESDSIAPDVVGISFDKEVIEDEGRNIIRVEVHDDLSGVTSVSGTCRSPGGAAVIPFSCARNDESGLWEGNVMIPEQADCGMWTVQQLTAKDKAGNTAHLSNASPVLAGAGFTLAPGPDCDSSPPTLEQFVLSKTVVTGDAATEILITATVHDVGSGVVSLGGWFEGPVTEGQPTQSPFLCAPDPDHPEAPWTGTIVVPQFARKGIWKLRSIELKDKAQNVRTYTPADPVMASGVFEVR